MSRGNKWVPMDKYLAQEFKSIKREFSMIEAMFSHQLDIDNGIVWSISGYSKCWRWSRNKVRRFLECIRTEAGHIKDSKRTHEGHPIHLIDLGLDSEKDTKRTEAGHIKDRSRYTTIEPEPKPEPKKENNTFDLFWEMYGKKTDRKKCFSKFKKLKQSDIDLIFEKLPAYIKSTPDVQYRKNPITYLNNESWNDEIIKKGKINGKAKNYTGPDTRESIIPDRMPEY